MRTLMRLSAACAVLTMVPGLAMAQSPTTGSMEKSGTKEPSSTDAQGAKKEPMQNAGSVGEGSATNGNTSNTGTAGNTGK